MVILSGDIYPSFSSFNDPKKLSLSQHLGEIKHYLTISLTISKIISLYQNQALYISSISLIFYSFIALNTPRLII